MYDAHHILVYTESISDFLCDALFVRYEVIVFGETLRGEFAAAAPNLGRNSSAVSTQFIYLVARVVQVFSGGGQSEGVAVSELEIFAIFLVTVHTRT